MGRDLEGDAPRLAHAEVRVYESVRTAHLERARDLAPASIVYFGRNYDFDPELTAGLDLVRLGGPRDLFGLLRRHEVRVLEINEPLMLSAVKYGLTAAAAARWSGLRGRPVRIVSYAIENAAPLESPSRRLRSPWRRTAFRLAVRFLVGQVDRVAFGTVAAQARYEAIGIRRRTAASLVPALSARCACMGESAPRGAEVVFVGAFDERKGLRQLLAAWPAVAEAVPGARLRVLGQGPLEDELRSVAAEWADVTWEVAPERTVIHARLQAARVLVLWSRPSPTWREQVGLPLVEGLSHGCAVVASEQTGIADWLGDHGHEVVPSDAPVADLASAVVRSLTSGRTPESVLADLPEVDGRLEADRWLFAR